MQNPKDLKGYNMSEILNLSHPIEDGMITYAGLPGRPLTDHLSREASRDHYEGTTFQIGKMRWWPTPGLISMLRFTAMPMAGI